MRTAFVILPFVAAASAAFAQDCPTYWSAPRTSLLSLHDKVHSLVLFNDGSGPALWAGGVYNIDKLQNNFASPTFPAGNVWRLRVVDFGGAPHLYACANTGLFRLDSGSWTQIGTGETYDVVAADLGQGPALYYSGKSVVRVVGSGAPLASFLPNSCGPTSLAVYSGGQAAPSLYFGGFFNRPSTSSEQYHSLARWDGSAWHTVGGGVTTIDFVCGQAALAGITAMVVFDDGGGEKLYVGGGFDAAGPIEAHGLAAWDGNQWSAVGPIDDTNGYVAGLTVLQETGGPALYVSGEFNSFAGLPAVGLARWDGATASIPFTGLQPSGNPFYDVSFFDDAWYVAGETFDAGTANTIGLARFGCGCPETDQSGTVDLYDLSEVLSNLGATGVNVIGNVDGDQDVDLGDLALILSHFGLDCP